MDLPPATATLIEYSIAPQAIATSHRAYVSNPLDPFGITDGWWVYLAVMRDLHRAFTSGSVVGEAWRDVRDHGDRPGGRLRVSAIAGALTQFWDGDRT